MFNAFGYVLLFFDITPFFHGCSKIITNKMTLMDLVVSRPSLYMFRASGSSSSEVHFFTVQASVILLVIILKQL